MNIDSHEVELLLAYLADELTDEEVSTIAARLKQEPALTRQLLLLARDEGSIASWAKQSDLPPLAPSETKDDSDKVDAKGFPLSRRLLAWAARQHWGIGIAVAAASMMVASLMWWLLAIEPTATLVRSYDVQWLGPALPGNAHLEAGDQLRFKTGLAELSMQDETRVFIEGPAHVVVESPSALRLHLGTLGVDIVSGHSGFTVHTPNGTIHDLGTRFGVATSPEDGTSVEVYAGRVEAIPFGASAEKSSATLSRGSAASISADLPQVKPLPFGQAQFEGVKDALATQTVEASDDHFVRGSSEWSSRNKVPDAGDNPELLLKGTRVEEVARKAWIKFHVDAAAAVEEEAKVLIRHAEPADNRDFVGHVGVYAVPAGFDFGNLGSDWSEEEITWDNAPGNLPTSTTKLASSIVRLGQLNLNTGSNSQPRGTCYSIRLPRLGDFLQTDGTVTVALSVEKQYVHDAVLLIAASEHGEIPGPELTYSVVAE